MKNKPKEKKTPDQKKRAFGEGTGDNSNKLIGKDTPKMDRDRPEQPEFIKPDDGNPEINTPVYPQNPEFPAKMKGDDSE